MKPHFSASFTAIVAAMGLLASVAFAEATTPKAAVAKPPVAVAPSPTPPKSAPAAAGATPGPVSPAASVPAPATAAPVPASPAAPAPTTPSSAPVEPSPGAPAPAPVTVTPSMTPDVAPAHIVLPEALELDAPEPIPAVEGADSPTSEPNQMLPSDPLAGISGGTAYLRSADNHFVLMPGGRLQVDGYFYKHDTAETPTPSFIIRRARLEARGWIGPWFFYTFGGDFAVGPASAPDPASQTWALAADEFVGIAPWKNLAMLQVGQFNAPFTLENRTSNNYFDFMERSVTVRALGAPTNKEVGAMLNGLLPNKVAYYSFGVFNGDGQNFRNVDDKFDFIARAWIAPFAIAKIPALEDVEVGGSMWLGDRGDNGLRLRSQTTQAGFTFLDPTWKIAPSTGEATPVEVHQARRLRSYALEVNVPVLHKYGFRLEYVHKHQFLTADDASDGALRTLTRGELNGWSTYGEIWAWVLGDDRILPKPGLELPRRLTRFETKGPEQGVMLVARLEHLDEGIGFDRPLPSDSVSGTREITLMTLGVNYWYSKHYRATFNYVLNHLDGDAGGIASDWAKLGSNKYEHEYLLRLAVAL